MLLRASHLTASLAVALTLHTVIADAIVVARVTRRGYIVVDDSGQWGGSIPAGNTRDLAPFIGAVTSALIDVPGFHAGRFLATMQIPATESPLAFYLPIRNDVRGLGQRSPLDSRSEVFDTNAFYDTAFPLDGYVYLNSYRFYTDPRAVTFGRFLICTQEFGHRFGAVVAVPPYPTGPVDTDAGDAAMSDATADDASADDVPGDVTTDASGDAASDVASDAGGDASGDGGGDAGDGGPAPLARDALLGRGNTTSTGMVVNRAHWSYFFNTGGSPLEGNAWTEIAPGMFQTGRPTFRFSPLDLYLMGIVPPSQVPPTFLIAEPQGLPRGVSRDSPPEYYNRQVTIRGRRVDVAIEDIIRANGMRNPPASAASHDLDVTWVLLAEEADIDDQLAAEFDEAIESCAMGYAFATAERGHLVTTVPAQPDAETPADAAVDAAPDAVGDAGPRRDVDFNPDVPNIPLPDGMSMVGDGAALAPTAPLHAEGGCTCRAGASSTSSRDGRCLAMAAVALAVFRRRRTRR